MKADSSFLKITVGFLVLSAVFQLIERVLGRSRGRPFLRRGWLLDVCFLFFTPLVTKAITRFALLLPIGALIALGVVSMESLKSGAYRGFGPLSLQPIWLQMIEIYLLVDLIGYWTHRLFHRGRWWPFHAVHHSSEDLDWLSSVRVHPVNDLVSKMIQVIPLLLAGFNPFLTLSAAPFFTFYALFLHANVDWDFGPLRGFLATPVFHRWHHSKDRAAWDKNFAGLFVFWDRIFGTYYMPPDRLPQNFGITEPFPTDFVGQLVRPFTQWPPKKSGAGLAAQVSAPAIATDPAEALVSVSAPAPHFATARSGTPDFISGSS